MKLLACGVLLLAACGGTAVVDGGSGGASGSTSSSSSSKTSSTSTTVITTPAHCSAHTDCPPGGVCIFSTGQCEKKCQGDFCATCDIGFICDTCATSSCPKCNDCIAACVLIEAGQCDDLNKCAPNQVCLFGSQTCAPACDANGGCADPNLVCAQCITGSCCGCDNCVSACAIPEG